TAPLGGGGGWPEHAGGGGTRQGTANRRTRQGGPGGGVDCSGHCVVFHRLGRHSPSAPLPFLLLLGEPGSKDGAAASASRLGPIPLMIRSLRDRRGGTLCTTRRNPVPGSPKVPHGRLPARFTPCGRRKSN